VSNEYESLKMIYAELWKTAVVSDNKSDEVAMLINTYILPNRERYKKVEGLTSVPWHVVAVIHGRESSYSFQKHLHNGDPLTARTRNVPSNRPETGTPPFTWETSAVDALMIKKFHLIKVWPVERICYSLEKYNGFGYRLYHQDVQSPYLWSYTNQYSKGKYVGDRDFDPETVDKQAGCMAIYKTLVGLGQVTL